MGDGSWILYYHVTKSNLPFYCTKMPYITNTYLPPVDLRAVCFVRAIFTIYCLLQISKRHLAQLLPRQMDRTLSSEPTPAFHFSDPLLDRFGGRPSQLFLGLGQANCSKYSQQFI